MSDTTHQRRRDRWLGRIRRLVNGPSSAGAASPPSRAPPLAPSPQTNNPFLADALRLLTERELSVVKEHVTLDVSNTVQAAYDAAQYQRSVCEQKKWPGSDRVDKVLLWLDRFKSVGDVIANVDPVHVGLPWAGIRILLEVSWRRHGQHDRS